jgi:hypothetical protein
VRTRNTPHVPFARHISSHHNGMMDLTLGVRVSSTDKTLPALPHSDAPSLYSRRSTDKGGIVSSNLTTVVGIGG